MHFELPFDDGDRARSFYEEAFGWQVQEMPEMSYTPVTTGPSGVQGPAEAGFVNGGLMPREGSPSAGPIVVVDVESIDVALERIAELGGAMGFAAYVRDPEGNVIRPVGDRRDT